MARPPTSNSPAVVVSEEAATESGNAMRLQLSSRTVSVGAGGLGVEQPPRMIISSSAPLKKASLPGLGRTRRYASGCLGMIAPSLG